MTIKELIEELKKYPEDGIVYHYESDTEGYIYSDEIEYVAEFGDGGVILN